MQALEHKIPPPAVGALIALLMWSVAGVEPSFALPATPRIAVTVLLAAAGLTFDVLGLIAFVRAKTTVNPLQPGKSSSLVTSGVYRVTRNPMYVGMALLLGAWAVHLGALWPFAGPLLFVLYINRFQIAPEERVLTGLFGAAYTDYMRRVRRWL